MLHHVSRALLVTVGVTALVIGIIGIFVPLLPTTPFVLLSAACFARSSSRLHSKLLAHSVFGPIITDWETHGAISRKVKWISTVSMVLMVSYPLMFTIESGAIKLLVVGTILSVALFIWTRPETVCVR